MDPSQGSDVGSIPITRYENMEQILSLIDINKILADPMLLVASVLIIVGPILFLFSLWKYSHAARPQFPNDFPHEHTQQNPITSNELNSPVAAAPQPAAMADPAPAPVVVMPPEPQTPEVEPPMPVQRSTRNDFAEKTVVMPEGIGELQGQMEIAFSQIKNLNKKMAELESAYETVAQQVSKTPKLELNELQEPPMNPADFTQKLLKLAEHVIILEKEMERLKKPENTRPPVMPI